MAERHGTVSYPGVTAFYSVRYTTSHGISPGQINLVTLPQLDAPPQSGDLTISDGFEEITIRGAKIDQLTVERVGNEGFVWSMLMVDRRWKWRDLGGSLGCYNQIDRHGKLIPWTIRSPYELAVLCLNDLGETNYVIDLPLGLDSKVGALAYQINPPWIGVTQTTNTNPCVNWYGTPPAHALAQLCEIYGRRIIYQWSTDAILITVPGVAGIYSAPLPEGSMAKVSPSISVPETPSGVTVIGSPTVYEDRLKLEPVGEDWDGSIRPISLLTYAPIVAGKPDWTGSDPHVFANVVATNRLTYGEARKLARKSVWRYYRVRVDKNTTVQGYGPLARRQQIALRSTRASQITPQPGDDQLMDRNGILMTVNLYNGYSRDLPAQVIGSVANLLDQEFFVPTISINTDPVKQIFYPFSTDPEEQMIIFGNPVYYQSSAGTQSPDLTLLTSFTIRNALTNQLEVFAVSQALPGASGLTNYAVRHYPDVIFTVIAGYDKNGEPTAPQLLEADPIARSGYYLAGMIAQYFQKPGLTIEYNGIRTIDLDSLTMQITWEVGPNGTTTTASQNTEHSIAVPPYPLRRRAEWLAPAARRRIEEEATPSIGSGFADVTNTIAAGIAKVTNFILGSAH